MPSAEELFKENESLRGENAVLRAQIEWLRKQVFGGRKSERLADAQMTLTLGALEKRAERDPESRTVTYERVAPKARPTPAETFAALPVTEVLEIIPEEVQAHPEAYERIGEERTFEVDIVQARLVKREIVRPKYRLKADKCVAPLLAPAPARAVVGGYASAGLLAFIALSKYVDHLPLYRLEQMSPRWGAPISRQTMCDWIEVVADWLAPIYRRMLTNLRQGGYLQADETPIRCHDPDERKGATSQGWLWVIGKPGGDVVFDWRLSRRHGELNTLLADYKGVLQSDGYDAYPNYVENHEGVVWVGCWAHARRKFNEAQGEAPKATRVVLKLIAKMYRLERQWDEAGITDAAQRAKLRTEGFKRTLNWIERIAKALRAEARPRSLLGGACDYLLGHWEPLTAHLSHGQTRLDNNLIENVMPISALRSLCRDGSYAELLRNRDRTSERRGITRVGATRHNRGQPRSLIRLRRSFQKGTLEVWQVAGGPRSVPRRCHCPTNLIRRVAHVCGATSRS
jgi:transposase